MGQILHLIRDLLWILCGIRDQTFGVRDQIFGYKKMGYYWRDYLQNIQNRIFTKLYNLQNRFTRGFVVFCKTVHVFAIFFKTMHYKTIIRSAFCDVSFYNNCSTGNSLKLHFTLVLPLSRLFYCDVGPVSKMHWYCKKWDFNISKMTKSRVISFKIVNVSELWQRPNEKGLCAGISN